MHLLFEHYGKGAIPQLKAKLKKNHQKAILTGRPIFWGKGWLHNQACCLPLRDLASHVRVKQLLSWLNIIPRDYTLLEDFRDRKNE